MLSVNRGFPFSILLSLLLLSSSAFAATISGAITDASTGKPVVFATVRILELAGEVHTDADGKYVFEEIPAGRYTVAVTFAGYMDYAIGVVETSIDGTKTLDAALQPDVAPLYRDEADAETGVAQVGNKTESNSLHDQPIRLLDMPIRGYQDYVALQPGTVRRFYGAPLHVRGGRIEEFGYDVDGFSQQDPFTGAPFTAINGNTIDDIRFYPGYSDPSHGWLASGHADIMTRETWAAGGSFEAITDNFHGERSDYNLYALDLSGPLLTKTPGRLTYAMAGEYRTIGNRDPGGPGDWNSLGAWHGNLRWRPSDRTSTLIGTRGSYEDWKYTPTAWYFNSVHAPRGIDENYSVFGKIEHNIARRTKLSASANWLSVSHRQGDGRHFDDLWAYGRPSGNPNFDQTRLFTAWNDLFLDPDSLVEGRYVRLTTPVVESTFTVELPNGDTIQRPFIIRGDEGTVWDDYFEQKGSYIGGRFDLSHAHRNSATSRIGFEFQRHNVRAYNHLFPANIYQGTDGGFDDISRYGYDEMGEASDDGGINDAKHPVFLAGFLIHHIELEDLTLDAGLRWDRFDYDTEALIDPSNPLDPFDNAIYADTASGLSEEERNDLRQGAQQLDPDELTTVATINRLSPRLSASFHAGEGSKLHFSAARYVQQTPLRYVYQDFDFLEYKIRTGGYAYVFGNPSIVPMSTIQYEAGLAQEVGSHLEFTARAFYRDISDRIGSRNQPADPQNFALFDNLGDATVKGLEFSATLERTSGLAAIVSYTLSSADERGNMYDAPNNIAWTNAEVPPVTAPVWYDQRHRIVVNVDLRNSPGGGPQLGNWHPLENAGVDLIADIGSGFPYSPVGVYNEVTLGAISPRPVGPVNSERSDWTYRIDLKANKSFAIAGADLELYIWVINLFDRENVVDVYNGTGQPDNTGYLDTGEGQQFVINNDSIHDSSFLTGEQKYNLRQNDPANFDIPRQIRFGMRVGF